jgi:hypothetical protein
MPVRIQMKVYSETRSRAICEEVVLPEGVTTQDAVEYVKAECDRLRKAYLSLNDN